MPFWQAITQLMLTFILNNFFIFTKIRAYEQIRHNLHHILG